MFPTPAEQSTVADCYTFGARPQAGQIGKIAPHLLRPRPHHDIRTQAGGSGRRIAKCESIATESSGERIGREIEASASIAQKDIAEVLAGSRPRALTLRRREPSRRAPSGRRMATRREA